MRQLTIGAVTVEYDRLGIDTQQTQTRYILSTGMKMVGVAFVALIASLTVSFFASRTAAGGIARDVRSAIFSKVENFSHAELRNFQPHP